MSEKLKQTFTNGTNPENLKISIVGGGLVIQKLFIFILKKKLINNFKYRLVH